MKGHTMCDIHKVLATLTLLFTAPALAQSPAFFDDFDGDALGPHWFQYAPGSHTVSNSMLTVTGGGAQNFAMLSTSFATQTNFQVDVWMGWSSASAHQRLEINLSESIPGDPSIASIRYDNSPTEGARIICTSFLGFSQYQWFSEPAPVPGIYQFTFLRTGSQMGFYLNGAHLGTLNSTQLGMSSLTMLFSGDVSEMSPLYVDRVQVVPVPGGFLLLAASMLMSDRRRRPVHRRK
jgi:hypothetical protein